MNKILLDDIVSLCKRRGFIYQGSEIYGGLAGTWDYGPLGVQLKRNVVNLWWKIFVESRDDMYAVDCAILMNSRVWQASGHTETFNDPLVECSNCHNRFRDNKVDSNKCSNCGKSGTFGAPKPFNMMFKTNVGPVDNDSSVSYLRPETAQGMFTNYKNIIDSFSPDLPFGVAQIGKAFRNEISPRDFIFRTREFEIMELEYFINPQNWEKSFEDWRKQSLNWFREIGLDKDKLKEVEVPNENLAHYSKRTIDFYYDFPSLGFDEIGGLAYRSDFDLINTQKSTGKSMDYRPKDASEPFVPHVIEPTYGLDRNILAVLANSYKQDKINGEKRVYLELPTHLAPMRASVSPLLKNKPELVDKSREVYSILKKEFGNIMWDDNGNIGKRYRRQDEIGTPHVIVIDFETIDNQTVTVRDRDTTKQERIKIIDLVKYLNE